MEHLPKTPLRYESPSGRVRDVSIWFCITLVICGAALVLAPWVFLPAHHFQFLLDSLVKVTLVVFTVGLGAAMIVLGYFHATRR